MISSQKLINSISSITERGAKTCKKTSDRNYTSDLKMARKQSFHLRSPVIHRHLAEGPEIWPKSEDTECAKGKTKAQEIQEYWECVTTTFAKSWNSCSDTGSSPMLVITWEQHTILMTLTKEIIIIFLTCCQKMNWYSHLSKFIHGELAVFIPGWNKDERWIVQLPNTTPCIGKYEVAKNVYLSNCLNASRSSFLLWLGPLFRLRATIWRKWDEHSHWG